MKPLFGLSDSGDRWHYTLRKHFIKDLSMKPMTGDLIHYLKHIAGQLCALFGTYVDDLVKAESREFCKFTNQTGQRFEAKYHTASKENSWVCNLIKERRGFESKYVRIHFEAMSTIGA